jgi:hypothetical protein
MRSLAIVTTFVLCASACNFYGTPTAVLSPSPSASPTSGEWTTVVRRTGDTSITIMLPPTWQAVDLDPKTIGNSYAKLASANPAFGSANSVETFRQLAAKGVVLYALDNDPVARQRFATNLQVLVQDYSGSDDIDSIAKQLGDQYERSVKAKVTPLVHVKIGTDDAAQLRVDYTATVAGRALDISLLQVVLLKPGRVHALAFTTLKDQFDSYRPAFDRIALSYRTGA